MPVFIKNILRPILSPILGALSKRIEVADPWEKHERKVPKDTFGSGNINDWQWYFDGKSSIEVSSVEQICHWLCECEYALDKDLFQEDDFWQHPVTLEATKTGDCEDQALWAWRKLTELGIYSELINGRMLTPNTPEESTHVWVLFHRDGEPFILEATARTIETMLMPLEEAKHKYCPSVSVSGSFQTYVYDGYIENIKATSSQ